MRSPYSHTHTHTDRNMSLLSINNSSGKLKLFSHFDSHFEYFTLYSYSHRGGVDWLKLALQSMLSLFFLKVTKYSSDEVIFPRGSVTDVTVSFRKPVSV